MAIALIAIGAATAAAETTPAPTQAACITDALKPVRVVVEIENAGVPKDMAAWVIHHNVPLPANCESQFGVVREGRAEILVQDAKHRSRWVPFGLGTLNNDRNGHVIDHVEIGNDGGIGSSKFYVAYGEDVKTGETIEFGNYECTPGPQTTGIKIRFEQLAVTTESESVLGRKIFTHRVTHISPKKC